MPDVQPKKFRFTLFIRGVITEVLANAPDGWLETKITYKTDSYYKGIRRSLTVPLKFVLKGGYLLRKELWTYGILARVVLIIDKCVSVATGWQYVNLYTGKVDFSKAEDTQTSLNADSITNDFTTQLDAYDSTSFAIPLTGNDVIDITLPSLTLKENCDFIMLPSPDFRSNAFFAIQIANYQQRANAASVQNAGFVAQVTPDFTTTGQWFFRPRLATIVRIYGGMGISVNSGHYQINIYRNSDGSLVKTLWEGTFGITTQVNFTFDFVTNVAQFETLSLYFLHVDDPNTNTGINMQYGTVSLEYNTTSPSSKAKGLRAFDLFKRLLILMNTTSPTEPNQPVPCQSFLLDPAVNGIFKGLVYTCSDSIRAFLFDAQGNAVTTTVGTIYQAGDNLQAGGRYLVLGSNVIYNGINYNINEFFDFVLGEDSFTTPDGNGFVKQTASTPSLIFTFKDFFQDILSLMGGEAALGIENGLVWLEDLSYNYRPGTGSLNLGIVDETTKIYPAIDKLYNTIKGGYADQQYDTVNGQQEVNSEVKYVTDMLSPANELNIQAKSRADPFGLEIIRVTPVDTAASRSDNDNFMLIVKDAPEVDGSFKPVQMDALTSFSGVDISYYNWFITPMQNLLRGSRYLRSIYDKMDGYSISVSRPTKSTALITTDINGRRVAESEDIVISAALGEPIFLPYYYEVKAALPPDASQILDANQYSDILSTWNDNNISAFPEEINTDEGENSPQVFKMLLSPKNKTVDLIR